MSSPGAKLPDILASLATASADMNLSSRGDNPPLNDAVRESPSCALVKGVGAAAD